MSEKYYHGTSVGNVNSILKTGFKSSYGRFGEGVYLTQNKLFAKEFTRNNGKIITCTFSGNIITIPYMSLNEIFPHENISIEEEEGYPPLKTYVLEKGYDAVHILYDENGDDEMVVYDPEFIKLISVE